MAYLLGYDRTMIIVSINYIKFIRSLTAGLYFLEVKTPQKLKPVVLRKTE